MTEGKEKEEPFALIHHFGYEVVCSLGLKALPWETQSVAIKEFKGNTRRIHVKKSMNFWRGRSGPDSTDTPTERF
ncbi:MAG: hypothetical protein ACUVTD_01515 [Nitrososphaerales archaeon]